MSNKKEISIPLIIITIVIGAAIFKQFDAQNLRFEKPALAIVYILSFVGCLYFVFKKAK